VHSPFRRVAITLLEELEKKRKIFLAARAAFTLPEISAFYKELTFGLAVKYASD
jgi:hypothetical protein